MARWNSCLKQIVTTRLFGLGIAIIVLPLSAIKNQKPCKLSLKTEAKSVLKANKYSQITMQNGEMIKTADATWFDNGLKISIIGTPGNANYRLSFQSKKNNVWYGDILFDRHD